MNILCKFVFHWLMLIESVNAAVTWNYPVDGERVSMDEDTNVRSVIIKLRAKSATSYTLESQEPESPSVFDLKGNNLILISNLDYETQKTYELTLVAHDAEDTSKVTMFVDVTDVNEAPEFTSNQITISVESGTAKGEYIYNVSEDVADPEGNQITYSIEGNGLAIDKVTGVITTDKSLNYSESSRMIQANVTATDEELSAELEIIVLIRTRPELLLPDKVEVQEIVQKGFVVYQFSFKDEDGDTQLNVSIEGQSDDGAFAINDNSNALVTNSEFDYESGNTRFIVTLKVSDSVPLASTSVLNISIVDVNDESPVFSSDSYSASVKENVMSVSSIIQVQATDADTEDNVTYSFDGENERNILTIDESTGVVGTQRPLDFGINASITTKVAATDLGGNKGVAELVVTVIEESEPYFINPSSEGSSIDIMESVEEGMVVYELSANDMDGDELSFTFTNDNDEFDLNAKEVLVASTLDYEEQILYTLEFEVTDTNEATATASLTINIIDENDNPPIFVNTTYQGVVVEKNSSPIKVITVRATDADSSLDNNNVVQYSITAGDTTNSFDIDETTGDITATNLKYNDSIQYTLEITAKDLKGAEGANEATAKVIIEVKSVPYWENLFMPVNVTKAENVDQSEVFFTLSAIDPDGDTLIYSILSQTVDGLFIVGGSNNSDVILNAGKSLDYEDKKKHSLTFEVTDSNSDPVESSVLEIHVTDVNDNAPVFSSNDINIVVKSTHSVGDIIKTITATDADSSAEDNNVLTYTFNCKYINHINIKLTSVKEQDYFSISTSGAMTLEKEVNVDDKFTLVLIAKDGGTPSMSGSVTLIVTTSEATDPVLSDLLESTNKTVNIFEDTEVETEVYTIESSDADGDKLLYTIESMPSEKFELKENVLVVSNALDSEHENTYTLTFGIDDDDGDTSNKLISGTLIVHVIDVNDNFPTFSKELYTVNVTENQPKEKNLIKLKATDDDISKTSNGAVEYSIVDGDLFDQFTVDPLSGQLSTKAVLWRSKQKYHVLAIQAKDKGTPARADSVHVIVNVKEIGDNDKNVSTKPNLCEVMLCLILVLSFC